MRRVTRCCALLVIVGADRSRAQSATLADSLIVLNRSGEWARAAQRAGEFLATEHAGRPDERCRVRASLIWATQRLQLTDSTRALILQFDASCSAFSRRDDFHDVALVRQELATGSSSVAGTPVPIPTPARPTDDFWKRGDPAALGLDVSALERHRALCEETGADACLVVFRGRIVQEWYAPHAGRAPSLEMYAMSTTKSVTGILVGMLLADGRIRSVDEPVCAYLPTWCTGLRGRVTLRHLLTMTSGLPRMRDSSVGFVDDKNAFAVRATPTREPGTAWAYSNEGAQLLSPILDKAAGEPIQEYARRRLFEPLGMRDTRLHADLAGHAWTYGDMETTPRDLARVGLLMLHRGKWDDAQIVPTAWVDSATRPSQAFNLRYGLLWWIDPEAGAFAGHGHLDTHLHVIPGSDLVVVRMQAKPKADVREGAYEDAALRLYPQMVPAKAKGRH
jgi:CubicO group peptidase (beta-lactamase class C family)